MSEVQSFSHHTEEAIRQLDLEEQWNKLAPRGTFVKSVFGFPYGVDCTISEARQKDGLAVVDLECHGTVPLDEWRPVVERAG